MSGDESFPYSYSFVALEGLSEDALETQLRLLPISSQILVLPSLQHYLGKEDDLLSSSSSSAKSTVATPFDARRYIRRVHDAAAARRNVALEFLNGSNVKSASSSTAHAKSTQRQPTSTTPRRIVFLNGGTATSQALCIEAIRKHDASARGNLERAALLFDQLTAHGVVGLDTASIKAAASTVTPRFDNASAVEDGHDDDPITKAMRAADALDRETEGLQTSTHILDLTIGSNIPSRQRPRSLSLPIHGELLDLLDTSRRLSHVSKHSSSAAGDADQASSIWVRPSVAAGASGGEIYDVNNYNFISPSFVSSIRSPSRKGSLSRSPTGSSTRSPTSTIFPVSMRLDAIAAQSKRAAVLLGPAPRGRSRHRPTNDLSSHGVPHQRRARSLERSGSSGSLGMNFLLTSSRDGSSTRRRRPSNVSDASSTSAAAAAARTYLERDASIPDVPLLPAADALEKMARGRKGAVPLSSRSSVSLKTPVGSLARQPIYVDRGTDARSIRGVSSSHGCPSSPVLDDAFEPVLPFVEDLVIHFDDAGASIPALELAIRHCKELGGARVVHRQQQSHDQFDQKTISSMLPETPKSSSHGHSPSLAAATTIKGNSTVDEYDPFAPDEYNSGPKMPSPPSSSSIRTTTTKPPTPVHTPPPPKDTGGSESNSARHPQYHVLATAQYQTVLALHNALRSILAIYFPRISRSNSSSATSGHDIFSYVPGLEATDLWVPLLGGVELVLAVGGQRGVQPETMARIVGQLDSALGGPADVGRHSGRLDIRYLMANAMQALAAQQVRSHITGATRGGERLTVEAKGLATLVLTQLDLYLRTHPSSPSSSVHVVLLDYPLELLAIVLALQQLVGRHVVQVASVIVANGNDPKDSGRPGFQKLRASPPPPLRSSMSSSFSTSSLILDPERPPYTRANYLLTSAASDSDVAAFVSSVRNTPSLLAASAGSMGRYSAALSTTTTATTIVANRGGSESSSRNGNIRTPPHESLTAAPPPPPPVVPLPLANAKKAHAKSSTATLRQPPKSPAPSTKSQRSLQSHASSQASSAPSQADSWRTSTGNFKAPAPQQGYVASIVPTTSLAPAPAMLPSGRLVAKTIQVTAPTSRRTKGEVAAVVNPPDMLEGRGGGGGTTFDEPCDDDDYDDFDDFDDDFENDLDMRRLMPLFMRDRAALLAAKEAAGLRGIRPPAASSKSSRLTGSAGAPVNPAVRRTMADYQSQGYPSSQAYQTYQTYQNYQSHQSYPYQASSSSDLRARASVGSMQSQQSRGANDGKKALKWLGLA